MALFIKRIVDMIGACIGILVLSPVMLFIAFLIKLDSKGPVFFKQERLGFRGKPFDILKFRTMIQNAQNLGKGIFVDAKDSRITKIGAFLRETSLDEIPQLLNILIGQMSFIGPRPPLTHYPYTYENYSEEQKLRFSMRPGITGWAQINGRNDIEWDERIVFDIEYVKRYSLIFDIRIVALSIKKVLQREGIY